MRKIETIIFDIGNVILNFDIKKVLQEYTKDFEKQNFIYDNIINSPEWLQYGLIDTGYLSRKDAIKIVQDRTNHIYDKLISDFWNNYNNYAKVDSNVLDLIRKLKEKGYKIYLLSNINPYTYEHVKVSGLFDIVDGYVLSYIEHQIKPYKGIYETLIKRYDLDIERCLFIDDNEKNIVTAKNLGIIAEKVEPDNYDSVLKTLRKYDL